jgi:hypothetical protein
MTAVVVRETTAKTASRSAAGRSDKVSWWARGTTRT